jgi:hypothetical protein
MTARKPVSDRDLVSLRQRGLILAEETAFWQDGVLTVENLINKQQRLLTVDVSTLLESNRRVLKG